MEPTTGKKRRPRPSNAAHQVKKLLISMPQRLLGAPSHTGALREWCTRVRAALEALDEAPSRRPVDTDIAKLAAFLLSALEPLAGTRPMPAPMPAPAVGIQDMLYTPIPERARSYSNRPHISTATTATTPAASRT